MQFSSSPASKELAPAAHLSLLVPFNSSSIARLFHNGDSIHQYLAGNLIEFMVLISG
tara:strand:+ start:249 stop:419 length:171 start_codon:yes stop_codon:yes gene_type:complete